MAIPRFICTCPDFTNRQPKNVAGASVSRQIDRDWSKSGSFGGVVSKGGYCKHIFRVLIELDLIDQLGIPGDLPTPGLQNYQAPSDLPRLQKSPRYGDDFSY